MATIDISRNHALSVDTAKSRAEDLARDLEKRMGITWRWEGNNIKFGATSGMAKGVTGSVSVAASQVRVEIDLPFLMRAMKGTLVSKVEEKLNVLTAPE
jgi:putative polyhydroxyalkanoate system protein